MRRREQVLAKREQIRELVSRHEAVNARIFGSVARGDDGPDSDVDVIVQFPRGATLERVCNLSDALEALLHCKVDLLTEHSGLSPRMRKNIEEDMVAL